MTVVARIAGMELRHGTPAALGFVVDSWCKSYEAGALASLGPLTPEGLAPEARKALCKSIHARVLRTVNAPDVSGLVLVEPSNPDTYLAHVIYSERAKGGPLVHFLYVLHGLRRQGVGAAILQAIGASSGGAYTHHTQAGARLCERFGLTFTPHASR